MTTANLPHAAKNTSKDWQQAAVYKQLKTNPNKQTLVNQFFQKANKQRQSALTKP